MDGRASSSELNSELEIDDTDVDMFQMMDGKASSSDLILNI